ncbi:MAG: hydroxyacid dehydrogenase [Desulfomonile tiedjei]|nr:hydroxyacid dehydrogenase [Desulfomonile tiedjei]
MRILFCGETFPAAPVMLRQLLPGDEIIACPQAEVKQRGLDVDVIVPLMHRLEPELIANTTARLIHQWGVGLEGVDIPAATARGILVCNVPADATANADSTAEHAVFLMLGVARQIHDCFLSFQTGLWGAPLGNALFGRTALIVGLGMVGSALARKLRGLDMRVEAIRRRPDPEKESRLGIFAAGSLDNLHEMASRADFVVSAITLTEETRGVFDKSLFDAMKPTACIVNVSRGPVVNEPDLVEALRNGTIAGAGLDVYAVEPVDPANPLLTMRNVFATPHVAGATKQTYEGIAAIVNANILAFKAGKTPRYCVNPGQLPE